ncbi:MAG: hypothetical protein V3U36_02845 [Anaerolineales bacterium]
MRRIIVGFHIFATLSRIRPALLVPSTLPEADVETTDERRAEWGVNDKVGQPGLGTSGLSQQFIGEELERPVVDGNDVLVSKVL